MNGDGRPDIATVSQGSVSVLLGQTGGSFAAALRYIAGSEFLGSIDDIAISGMNSDGKLDIVTINKTPGSSSNNTVSVLLNLGATPMPIANGDVVNTTINTAVTTGNVLANDVDTNATGSLNITAFDATSVQGGAVINNGNSTFTYWPLVNFTGTDTFTYTITDGTGKTAVGTVTVNVAAATPTPPQVAVAAYPRWNC